MLQDGACGTLPSKHRETEWGWDFGEKLTCGTDAGFLAFWEGVRPNSSVVPRCWAEVQTLQNLFPPFPWGLRTGAGLSSPEPGLSRSEEAADRGALSILAGPNPAAANPSGAQGLHGPAQPCVCIDRGGVCHSCHWRPRFYHWTLCPVSRR